MSSSFIGQSSGRITSLREAILSAKRYICLERIRIVTDVYKKNPQMPVVVKRALALKEILENMSVYIPKGDLLAANHASRWCAAPIFPEYSVHWIIDEIDRFDKRSGDIFHITKEDKTELLELCQYWLGKTSGEKAYALLPEDTKEIYESMLLRAEATFNEGDGHVAPDFHWILTKGLHAIKEKVRQRIGRLDNSNVKDLKKYQFLKAVLITFDAAESYALRYSRLAAELADKETDATRACELREISRICAHVPMKPARSFHEAVQAIWFIQVIQQLESNGHSYSFGRLDQYLYPYYEKDIKAGRMTEEQACELLENLWVKTYTISKLRNWASTRNGPGNPLYQNVTIGGQTRDGKPAENALSYLVLKSYGRVRLSQPNLTVRYFHGLSDEFMMRCIEVIKLGTGMPAFNNDEVLVDSFRQWGVTPEDARDYCAIGCVETAVPGKWGTHCTGMCFTNLPKMLMTILNGGVEPISGVRLKNRSYRHFLEMESFGELMQYWDDLCFYLTKHAATIDNCTDTMIEEEVPDVFSSAFTHYCIERGKHLKSGGAKYDIVSGVQQGIANVGNSLMAIKKLVFDDKALTKEQLWHALETNFEGEEGEKIRQILVNGAPKYGNDIAEVDELTARAYISMIEAAKTVHNTRYGRGPIHGGYFTGTSGITKYIPMGAQVGATPDGRKAFEPLSDGSSPFRSTDVNGPTAVMKSLSRQPNRMTTGGALLNQKFSPAVFRTRKDDRKFLLMLRTFFNDLKGLHIQFNIVDRETLLDAQKHPENHRDLVVRVAGYSAFFNILSPETQNDIIARTEQTL
ncbi:MAG: glycyl radical protein [Christensenellales bacterium]